MADKTPAADEPKTVEVTILRGSIRTGDHAKGEANFTTHGPGAKVTVPVSETASLIARGIIADPNAEAVSVGPGPMFSPETGPTITEEA